MSLAEVERLLGKALTDHEFRDLLKENSAEAFIGFDLTDEEKTALSNIDSMRLEDFAQSLDERITKAFTNIG